jgi:hypothetical protein
VPFLKVNILHRIGFQTGKKRTHLKTMEYSKEFLSGLTAKQRFQALLVIEERKKMEAEVEKIKFEVRRLELLKNSNVGSLPPSHNVRSTAGETKIDPLQPENDALNVRAVVAESTQSSQKQAAVGQHQQQQSSNQKRIKAIPNPAPVNDPKCRDTSCSVTTSEGPGEKNSLSTSTNSQQEMESNTEETPEETPAPMVDTDPKSPIRIHVSDPFGDLYHFKIGRNKRFEKLISAYALKTGFDVSKLHLVYDTGRRVRDFDTPLSIGIEDGETLYVYFEQSRC